jgi:hypothetical protein
MTMTFLDCKEILRDDHAHLQDAIVESEPRYLRDTTYQQSAQTSVWTEQRVGGGRRGDAKVIERKGLGFTAGVGGAAVRTFIDAAHVLQRWIESPIDHLHDHLHGRLAVHKTLDLESIASRPPCEIHHARGRVLVLRLFLLANRGFVSLFRHVGYSVQPHLVLSGVRD